MMKVLLIALYGVSLCVAPVAQAHQNAQAASVRVADNISSQSASTIIVAANNTSKAKSKSESTVDKCVKWVTKEVKVRVGNRLETRKQTVCLAVRG